MVSLTNPLRVAITGLCLLACMFATFYFLVIWKTGLVYTHLFYLPIILVSLWWHRKGIILTSCLILVLLTCNFFFAPEVSIVENLARSTIFLFISILTSTIFEHRKKAAEKVLRKSEKKYKFLYESSPIVNLIIGIDGIIKDVNRLSAKSLGYSRDEVIGKRALELVVPEQRKKVAAQLERDFRGEYTSEIDVDVYAKDGSIHTILFSSGQTVLYEGDQPTGVLLTGIDITERKKMEEALERQRDIAITLSRAGDLNEVLNQLFDNLLEIEEFDCAGFYLVDEGTGDLNMIVHRGLPDSYVEKVSHLDADSPYAKVVMEGKPIYQKTSDFPPAIREDLESDGVLAVAAISIQYKGEVIGDLNMASHTHDGVSTSTRHVLESIGAQIGEAIVRARMEEKLRESREKFERLFIGNPEAAVYVGSNLHVLDVNPRFEKLFGYSLDEIKGKHIDDLVVPKDKMEEAKMLDKKAEKEYIYHDTVRKRKDGSLVPVSISAAKIIVEGQLIGYVVLYKDITERKKAEELYRSVIELSPDGIVTLDMKGVITSCNTTSTRMSGYSRDELVGNHFTKLGTIRPRDLPKYLKLLNSALRGKVPKPFEINCIRKDGTPYLVDVRTGLLKEGDKTIGFQIISRDITERKKMEEKLKQYTDHLEVLVEERTRELKESQDRLIKSERFAAIGELATMVGHDLRNPLTGIAGAAYYLKMKLDPKMDKKTKEMLELVEKDIEYSNKIINDLLEYSKEIWLELTKTTPKSIIKAALTLIKVPKNIRISDLTTNEGKIKIDMEKTKRVFVNIIKNAIDAMPKGGNLTIKSKKTNGNLEIAFTDTGIGMPKETLEKLWTPLFTTKTKGMGLGLSICKRIIEAHEGKISVESTVGKGTTFTVIIPIKPKLEGGEKIWVNVPESLLSTTTKA